MKKYQKIWLNPNMTNETIYEEDDYLSPELISVDIKGQLRSLRLANLVIRPVDYNPASGTIRVTKSVDFIIHFDGADLINTETLKEKYYSPYFESVYRQVTNYESPDLRDDLVSYPVTYVIITNPIFENTLSEFIDWKIQRGFTVVVGNTSEIGSSTSAIKSYIQDLYENPTDAIPAPSFVLFVGDVAQVPTYSGTTGGHVTDLYLSLIHILRAHETVLDLVCRLLLEKKKEIVCYNHMWRNI